ncbi:MAG: Signal transduction histidine kinase [Mucilaginibacter sp.]|jgi:two-component system sensor histidine kinase VicK|nr:Signal transduction histidine kinase [Mucilaginibacter sp.]
MRVYFFTRINLPNRSDFRTYSTFQNLRTVKTVSLIYLIINVIIRLVITLNDVPLSNIKHIDEYNNANIITIVLAALFYIGSLLLIKFCERNNFLTFIDRAYSLFFALFIIISGMRATFFVMHNPRNTMVMYLIGLLITGMFFTFEYFETLFLVAVTGECFALLLPFYQHEFSELLMNNLASFVLLTLFFCISRFAFSYRADNYLKLKAIEEKNSEIETASQLKNEILGIVAHDLRNPLAAIKTIAMMMEEDVTLDADNKDNLQMIKSSCDKAATIINDLIETAHNDLDNSFDIEEVELNQYLLKIVDEWVKNKMGSVALLYYGTEKQIYTHINMEKMQRVMDNLISNAIKFSGEGDRVEVRLRDTDGQIFIDVKDFGMGIPEKLLPYIFDRFSKASRKGIRGEESIGLGLSIVRQIVRKHGGEIEVDSAENRGTTFTITMSPAKVGAIVHS